VDARTIAAGLNVGRAVVRGALLATGLALALRGALR
jgi:hypothetical protein